MGEESANAGTPQANGLGAGHLLDEEEIGAMLFDEGDDGVGVGTAEMKVGGEYGKTSSTRGHFFPAPKGAGKHGKGKQSERCGRNHRSPPVAKGDADAGEEEGGDCGVGGEGEQGDDGAVALEAEGADDRPGREWDDREPEGPVAAGDKEWRAPSTHGH